MKLTYITNTKLSESSGGGSGINNAIYNGLKDYYDVDYLYLNPKLDKISKLISITKKLFGIKRNYHFFSEKRLTKVQKLFHENKGECDFLFFHGFTPWIKIKSSKPYFCFNDACFATYVDIYNNKNEFSEKDLSRIYDQERTWLINASTVFFRSQWALNETKNIYNISGENFKNVGVGGFIEIPKIDEYSFDKNFLFIAREFIPKGGSEAAKALQILRKTHKDSKLIIVGEKPPKEILALSGVHYEGFLNKSVPQEKKKLIEIFKKSVALVHPTLKDTNTLVINELAYYGCPAISSNRFAISEYIKEGETGYLLENPRDVNEIAQKMHLIISDKDNYLKMRKATRLNALENNTWPNVLQRIINNIKRNYSARLRAEDLK